jgi:hypothetical protein
MDYSGLQLTAFALAVAFVSNIGFEIWRGYVLLGAGIVGAVIIVFFGRLFDERLNSLLKRKGFSKRKNKPPERKSDIESACQLLMFGCSALPYLLTVILNGNQMLWVSAIYGIIFCVLGVAFMLLSLRQGLLN